MAVNKIDRYLRIERGIDKYLGSVLVWFLSLFKQGRSLNRRDSIKTPGRILLIKLHGIGNIIMMLPSIRLLKRVYPEAQIDLLTFESNRQICEDLDEIAEVLTLGRKHPGDAVISILVMLFRIRRASYDIVIDFEQFAYISSILAFASGASGRVGFNNPTHIRHFLYTDQIPYRETEHMSGIFLKLAETVTGYTDPAPDRYLHIRERDRQRAASFLEKAGLVTGSPIVLIHPGSSANFTNRQWPLENFARLADRLGENNRFNIVVTGNREEQELVVDMLSLMDKPGASAAGKLSIMELAALCAMASFVVSSDTLLVHLASAAGTPVIGLYGPNTPFLYGPAAGKHHTTFYRNLPCSPCLVNVNRKISHCRDPRCMKDIKVEDVASAIFSSYIDTKGLPAPGTDLAAYGTRKTVRKATTKNIA